MGLLTGEVGAGKSTAARVFTASLNPSLYKILYVHFNTGSALDLLRRIASTLDRAPAHFRGDLVRQISDAIVRLNQSKKQHPILICETDGQPAHTREMKLGCVFTQTGWDKEGYAMRDEDSTTYTGAIETAEELGKRIYREAWDRGWGRAEKKVLLGDGAPWIWNIGDQYFAGAVQIVTDHDIYRLHSQIVLRLTPVDGRGNLDRPSGGLRV